VGSPD